MSSTPRATIPRRVQPRVGTHEPARRALPRTTVAPLALAAYLAFALFVTWPWASDPGGILYGIVGGDLTNSVAVFQQLAEERQPPFFPGEVEQINAPEGLPTDWAVHLAGIGSSATLWVLSLAFGAVAAHGLVAVLGFTLSAFAMFLLARHVTQHAGVAFVVGLAFGFWPFMYGTGWTWPHYIHLWGFVLLTWRMLVVAETPTLRNGLLAGAAAVVAMTWIQYHLLIGGVAFATLAVLAVARAAVRGRLRPQLVAQAVAAAIVALAAGGALLAGVVSGYSGVTPRPEAEAVANSARVEMYAVPGPRHPVFGDETGPWLLRRFAGPLGDPPTPAIYADIYLGISLLLVALCGAAWTVVGVWRYRLAALGKLPYAAGASALLLGGVALLFSAPPKVNVLGVAVPMPYTLLNEVTTVFRVAHRFAVLVMLAACLLAGLALAALLHRRALVLQAAVLAGLTFFVAVDLRAQPEPSTTEVSHAPIYELLGRQAPGIVAEYPLSLAYTALSQELFDHEAHEHPIFAGAGRGSGAESRKFELQFLLEERTVPDLAGYGVRYVLVHHPVDQSPILPRPGQSVRGLRLIGGDRTATLYRVVARPRSFTSYGVRGFHLTEGNPPGMRWVGENGAELEVRGSCAPCVGTVAFQAGTFAIPRTLTVRDQKGRILLRDRIAGAGQRVRFGIRFPGRAVLRLSTDPPPRPVNSVVPGADTRLVGIFVGQPVRFLANPQEGHRPLPVTDPTDSG
jgi:hypothetical protein